MPRPIKKHVTSSTVNIHTSLLQLNTHSLYLIMYPHRVDALQLFSPVLGLVVGYICTSQQIMEK